MTTFDSILSRVIREKGTFHRKCLEIRSKYASAWYSADRVIQNNRPRSRNSRGPLYVDQKGNYGVFLNPCGLRCPDKTNILCFQAVAVRKHLERNRKDKDSKFRLILIESRIHRLSRYYKTVGALPPTWRYESATASTLVA